MFSFFIVHVCIITCCFLLTPYMTPDLNRQSIFLSYFLHLIMALKPKLTELKRIKV